MFSSLILDTNFWTTPIFNDPWFLKISNSLVYFGFLSTSQNFFWVVNFLYDLCLLNLLLWVTTPSWFLQAYFLRKLRFWNYDIFMILLCFPCIIMTFPIIYFLISIWICSFSPSSFDSRPSKYTMYPYKS